jgi:hypothetical protein
VRNIIYVNMNTGATFTKEVHHLVCTNLPASMGDSGGPVYQRVGTDDAKAAGLLVAGTSSTMCFDPVGNIENNTGSNLWQY